MQLLQLMMCDRSDESGDQSYWDDAGKTVLLMMVESWKYEKH